MKTLKKVFAGVGLLGVQLGLSDDAVVKKILPSKAESAWQAIDWKTDLWGARKEAGKLGKPIYLWEMDGHPLGCV